MDSCSSEGRDQAGVRDDVEFQAGVAPFCQFAEALDWPTAVGTFHAGVIPVVVDQAGVLEDEPAAVLEAEAEWLGVVVVVAGFQAGVRADEEAFQAGVLELELA